MPKFSILEVRHPKESLTGAPIALLCQRDDETRGTVSIIRLRVIAIRPNRHSGRDMATRFAASYDSQTGRMSLSSENPNDGTGAVFIDPERLRGLRIGSYLMSEIVAWARQWPDAKVNHIRLVELQATADNIERRAKFYAYLGVRFSAGDEPVTASQLTHSANWKKNITVTTLDDFLTDQITVRRELDECRRTVEMLRAELKDKPVPSLLRRAWWSIFGRNVK